MAPFSYSMNYFSRWIDICSSKQKLLHDDSLTLLCCVGKKIFSKQDRRTELFITIKQIRSSKPQSIVHRYLVCSILSYLMTTIYICCGQLALVQHLLRGVPVIKLNRFVCLLASHWYSGSLCVVKKRQVSITLRRCGCIFYHVPRVLFSLTARSLE